MKRIMALVLAIIMILGCISTILFATASAKESTFTDVMGTVSEWANVYIEKMVDRGILDGIGGGKFNPEGLLTREQFAKVLVLGIPKEDKGITSEFSDVVSGSWYEEFVKKAVSTGIMKGYSKEEFGVSDSIKRCDMALGIARLDKTDEELKTYADKIPATVEDRDTIPDYAKGAMGYCYEKGIFSGDEKGNFKPFDNTTRAQIAKVICVYLENAEKEITSEITEEITSEITEEITSEPSDEITFEPTSEVSEEKEEKPSRPLITGDFIQPGLSASWSQTRWNNHFDELLEAGIDTFIIQWIAETPNGVLTTAYYPAELSGYPKANSYDKYAVSSNMLERCLKAAESRGIKVYIGLNAAEEWWSKGVNDRNWYVKQSEIGNEIATEIYDLYQWKYPNAFAGFYWWFEMYNGMGGKEQAFAEMININLDYLTRLDKKMPFVLSPFVKKSVTVKKTQEEWTKFFSYANFRKGDIFTMQDAVGAGHMSMELLDQYYAAIKKAVDTEPNVEFWANNENFIQSTWSSSPLTRVVEQLNITSKYVTKHISFSYTHYYSSAGNKPGNYHEKYLDYKNNGVVAND